MKCRKIRLHKGHNQGRPGEKQKYQKKSIPDSPEPNGYLHIATQRQSA